jgi:hypothetical protein
MCTRTAGDEDMPYVHFVAIYLAIRSTSTICIKIKVCVVDIHGVVSTTGLIRFFCSQRYLVIAPMRISIQEEKQNKKQDYYYEDIQAN